MAVKFGFDIPECPSGNIIGDITQRVQLVAPSGNVQREANISLNECPKEWAKAVKAELLADKCGDGLPISKHPHLVESIYGKGKWEVRIYDGTYGK